MKRILHKSRLMSIKKIISILVFNLLVLLVLVLSIILMLRQTQTTTEFFNDKLRYNEIFSIPDFTGRVIIAYNIKSSKKINWYILPEDQKNNIVNHKKFKYYPEYSDLKVDYIYITKTITFDNDTSLVIENLNIDDVVITGQIVVMIDNILLSTIILLCIVLMFMVVSFVGYYYWDETSHVNLDMIIDSTDFESKVSDESKI